MFECMATTHLPETEAARDLPGVLASVKSLRRERAVHVFALESRMRPKTSFEVATLNLKRFKAIPGPNLVLI